VFTLATFPNFLRCYVFLCKVAEDIADEVQEVFSQWESNHRLHGTSNLKKIAKAAKQWQYSPQNSPHKHIHFIGAKDANQDNMGSQVMEDWELSKDDPREGPMIADVEHEGGGDLLTRANLQTLDTVEVSSMAKDIETWTQSLNIILEH
jgi:hypothetical protein